MDRNFIPGSRWLYIKLYTGYKSADTVLVNYIQPFIKELELQNKIKEYFFIRYSDPKFHLRLRLHIEDPRHYDVILTYFNEIFNECIISKLIYNIQFDTYNREIERYGEQSVELVESFFCIDSRSILKLLEQNLESQTAEQDRWLLALKILDDTLDICQYDPEQKSEFLKTISEQFKYEFNFHGHFYKKQLDDKYRNNQKLISKALVTPKDYLGVYNDILQKRVDDLSPLITEITKQNSNKSIDELLPSLLHMSMNRMFRSRNRLYEMVLYDFLSRYYISLLAQKKKNI